MTVPVRAEDWPYGLRCGKCERLLEDGDLYTESLEGFTDEVPVVMPVCPECYASL